ncbi:Asp23/Gls24 family envelope stress response protein [Devriesea agamarum]|uniref:hypothetical protein n=1 Tax=Devriesea agamarum TaxID=472569 RepID=UPI00071D7DC0|nr:hypothetical protein [Devriesea agamarum]
MSSRPHASNRVILIIVGLLVLAVGTGWILLAAGVGKGATWPGTSAKLPAPGDHLVPESAVSAIASTTGWSIGIAVGVILVIIGLFFALRQIPRSPSPSQFSYSSDGEPSRTEVVTSAISDAIADDVQDLSGVSGARARLVGSSHNPGLMMEIRVEDRADARQVLNDLESQVIPDAQRALGVEFTEVGVRIRAGGSAPSRRSVVLA